MKIALIGATGHVGHYFLNEALQRGHAVTALVRDPSKLAARDGLCVVQADVSDPAQVASAVAGHEVVISAFNGGWGSADLRARHAAGSQAILDGVKRSGVPRLLVLGGAGSLEIAPASAWWTARNSPSSGSRAPSAPPTPSTNCAASNDWTGCSSARRCSSNPASAAVSSASAATRFCSTPRARAGFPGRPGGSHARRGRAAPSSSPALHRGLLKDQAPLSGAFVVSLRTSPPA